MSTNNYVKNWAVTAVMSAFIVAAASQYTLHRIDEATKLQCQTHDWPKAAHQIHMDWCADNGYKTN